MPLMNTFTFLTFTRPLAIPSDISAALLKLSFAFVSHFIAEEGYSILNETSTQRCFFLVSDNTFLFLRSIIYCSENLRAPPKWKALNSVSFSSSYESVERCSDKGTSYE